MDFSKKRADGFYGPTFEEWQAQLTADAEQQEAFARSALEKLAKLGLSPEEVQALFS